MSEIRGFEVVSDERAGEGGFLRLRRLRLKLVRADGTLTGEGLYDYVERPMGLDAVVLALWHRRPPGEGGGVDVLLRESVRVPIVFGRDEGLRSIFELVAGILETGDSDIASRAIAEAHEEAGLTVDKVEPLGPPLYPTPGMCAEKFHFAAAEVTDPNAAVVPPGDGSPFEEGARLHWMDLDAALTASDDMKTELGLRRLKDYLAKR